MNKAEDACIKDVQDKFQPLAGGRDRWQATKGTP